jgi:crossover junction endodeoxyribonuclease RuvC
MTQVTVLGIDPGYDRVGWAVGAYNQQRKVVVSGYGCIQTNKKNMWTTRYQMILNELEIIFKEYQPTEVAIESIFFSQNKTTAMQVAEARGIIIGYCLKHTNHIANYTPPEIKAAVTGHGAANKTQVAKMVALQLGIDLSSVIDDAVDAMAIVITHLAARKLRSLA